ncbi:hematopoietic prostaglandin D synthase-like [Liolophura sinensis]|uniref:hematopoietic prostaglandin D synthase-like n=1 Tax=Liolophura sinensis TaxID=3198878 RepID=UPI00315872DC
MPRYKLIYFNARGRGEVARMLFAEAGVDYEDERIERSEWPVLKSKMPYGQLPVLEVDGVQIAQSTAIFRYLAREFGYAGKTSIDQALADMFVCSCDDLVKPLIDIYRCKDEKTKEEMKQNFLDETAPLYLSKFEEALVLNNGYLVGDSLTWADLVLISTMPWVEKMVPPETLAPFPKIKDHKVRIESLPKIASWIEKRPKTDM